MAGFFAYILLNEWDLCEVSNVMAIVLGENNLIYGDLDFIQIFFIKHM